MVAFHEVQFPSDISYGSAGGPKRLTQIVALQSGYEERNQVWAHSRRQYDAGVGLRSINDIHDVLEFWEARSGALYGFRWKDWADYKSCAPKTTVTNLDQIIATGDDSTVAFQLIKRYTSGGNEYARLIRKPVANSVVVAIDSVAQTSGWTVDTTTGIITFDTPPGDTLVITAGYEFDTPARFESDDLSVSIDGFEAGAVQSVGVIEIRV